MTTLKYRSYILLDDLQVGECTVHRAGDHTGEWWLLWFRFNRETDGQPMDAAVPINPNGTYSEADRKTWGLTKTAPGTWQIAPSINVLASGDLHPGEHPDTSLWHQTPTIVEVPDGEPWQS